MDQCDCGISTKKPKNVAEAKCYDELKKQGWTSTKRGWPDFFCIKDGEICVVEVKPKSTYGLKHSQAVIMSALAKAGINCYYYAPDCGLKPMFQSKE